MGKQELLFHHNIVNITKDVFNSIQIFVVILVLPPGYFLSNSATSVVPLYFMNAKQDRDG